MKSTYGWGLIFMGEAGYQKLDDMLPRVKRIESSQDQQRDTCSTQLENYTRRIDKQVNQYMF